MYYRLRYKASCGTFVSDNREIGNIALSLGHRHNNLIHSKQQGMAMVCNHNLPSQQEKIFNLAELFQNEQDIMANVYEFQLTDKKGNSVSLADYKGKVLLIVNTATECGFTPQYDELEALYKAHKAQGLEILDVPCNQFGGQAPGTDEEIKDFCTMKFGVDFPQFKKSEVNGAGELPLYTFLKKEKGFKGFDPENKLTPVLEGMFDKTDPDWRKSNDIKWNFTKFLIDREGHVVERFEPTHDIKDIEKQIEKLL